MTGNGFKAETLPAGLTLAAAALTLVLILAFRHQLPIPKAESKLIGFLLLYSGIGLMIWAATHAEEAIRGLVSPLLDRLVVTGAYRFVRHPVYLASAMAVIGAAMVARRFWGLLSAVGIFLPVEVRRARLEERALEKKFGDAWGEYASRVGFFLPWVGRK